MKVTKKKILGRYDKIDFPDFHLENVPVKIDTGAFSSSLHCHQVCLEEIDGKEWLKVVPIGPRHPNFKHEVFYYSQFSQKKVKSSNGESDIRFLVPLRVIIFDRPYTTWFSLSERHQLRFPVLLGRRLLRKRFMVDVSKKNCSYARKMKKA